MLVLVSIVFYCRSLFFQLTGLDDFILLKRLEENNSNFQSLTRVFKPGSYGPWVSYYRPVFYDTIILNYLGFGSGPFSYHLVNVFLHALVAWVVMNLLQQLHFTKRQAFVLSLIYALHPLMTQAVCWIPGRNDLLLGLFTFSYCYNSIEYSITNHRKNIFLAVVFLALALFTKEAALMAPLGLTALLVFRHGLQQFKKEILPHITVAAIGWCLIFIARYLHAPAHLVGGKQGILSNIWVHKYVPFFYLGKIVAPFNLGTFPAMASKDLHVIIGGLAISLLSALVIRKKLSAQYAVGGLLFFGAFIIPFIISHDALIGKPLYEHRMYIPLLGVLIVAGKLLNSVSGAGRKFTIAFATFVLAYFTIAGQVHQSDFSNSYSFWKKSVENAPNNPRTNLSFALQQLNNEAEAIKYISRAEKLSPNEHLLQFSKGVVYMQHGKFDLADSAFKRELATTKYYECYFYLSKIAFDKNDFNKAVAFLMVYNDRNPYYSLQYKHELNQKLATAQNGEQLMAALYAKKMQCYFEN